MSGTSNQYNALQTSINGALIETVENHEESEVERPIDAEVAVDDTDKRGANSLFKAVSCCDKTLVQQLVEKGGKALVNARDVCGRTPLFYAITKSKEIAEYLIKKGADVNLKDFSNRSSLSFFIENCMMNEDIGLTSLLSDKKREFKMLKPSKDIEHDIKTILGILFCNLPLMCASSTHIPTDKTRKLNQEKIGKTWEKLSSVLKVSSAHFAERDTQKKNILDNILKDFEETKTLDDIAFDDVFASLVELIGANPNFADSDGNTALHYAACLPFLGASTKIIMLMLHQLEMYGLTLNTRNHLGQTPLLFCLSQSMKHLEDKEKLVAMKTSVEVCKLLVTRGSSLAQTTQHGESIFHLVMKLFQQAFEIPNETMRKSVTEETKKLLDLFSCDRLNKRTTVNNRNSRFNSPLHVWATLTLPQHADYSSSTSRNLFETTLKYILEHLLNLGATLNPRNEDEKTPLHLCKTWSAVKLLIDKGANPNDVDSSGRSPLLTAAINKTFETKSGCFYPDVSEDHEAFWKSVIEKGLNPLKADKYNKSVLSVLIEAKAYFLAIPILDEDFINTHSDFTSVTDNEGKTALFYAVRQSNESVVLALINAGADLNITDKEGKTALFYAARSGRYNERVVRALIDAGVNINITDEETKAIVRCCMYMALDRSLNLTDRQLICLYKECLVFAHQFGDVLTVMNSNLLLGVLHERIGLFKEALLYYQTVLEIAAATDTIGYYEKALKTVRKVRDKRNEAKICLKTNNIYSKICRLAVEYHKVNLTIAMKTGNKKEEMCAHFYIGDAYLDLCEYYDGFQHLELESLKMALQLNDKEVQRAIYKKLSQVSKSLGKFQESIEYEKRGLEITKELGYEKDEQSTYGKIADAYVSLRNYSQAIENYGIKLGMSLQMEDKKEARSTYIKIGNAYLLSLGRQMEAIENYEKSLEITFEIGDKIAEGKTYENLGKANLELGNITEALENFNKSLNTAIELSDKAEEGAACVNIGDVYFATGEYKEAIEYYKKGEGIAFATGNRHLQGIVYNNLGSAYFSMSAYSHAEKYFNKSLENALETIDKDRERRTVMNLGNVYFALGKYQEAIEHLERAVSIAVEIGDKNGEAASLVNLARVLSTIGKCHDSIKYSLKGLDILLEINDKKVEETAYMNLGSAYLLLGRYTEAERYVKMAVEIAKEINDRSGEGKCHIILGNVYLSLAKFQEAVKIFEESLDITKKIGDKNGEGIAHLNLGNTSFFSRETDKAIGYYQKSLAVAQEIGNKKLEGTAYFNLGIAHFTLLNYREAFQFYEKSLNLAIKMSNNRNEAQVNHSLSKLCYDSSDKYRQSSTQNFKQQSINYMKESAVRSWKWVIEDLQKGNDVMISSIHRFLDFCKMIAGVHENTETAIMIYNSYPAGKRELCSTKFWDKIQNLTKTRVLGFFLPNW